MAAAGLGTALELGAEPGRPPKFCGATEGAPDREEGDAPKPLCIAGPERENPPPAWPEKPPWPPPCWAQAGSAIPERSNAIAVFRFISASYSRFRIASGFPDRIWLRDRIWPEMASLNSLTDRTAPDSLPNSYKQETRQAAEKLSSSPQRNARGKLPGVRASAVWEAEICPKTDT